MGPYEFTYESPNVRSMTCPDGARVKMYANPRPVWLQGRGEGFFVEVNGQRVRACRTEIDAQAAATAEAVLHGCAMPIKFTDEGYKWFGPPPDAGGEAI